MVILNAMVVASAFLLLASLPTYSEVHLDGWTVHVEAAFSDSTGWQPVERELENQLYRIARVVPDGPLAKLRTVQIWVTKDDPKTPCAAFHPAAQWLRDNGLDPQMAHGLQIANAQHFLSWTHQQPWMVLHELSHAYHFLFLDKGFDNPKVKAAYDKAMASGKYDRVLRYDGVRSKHYAETNPMEFFAESSEAYFGRNDFYPFINAELKDFDPSTYHLMHEVWGEPKRGD